MAWKLRCCNEIIDSRQFMQAVGSLAIKKYKYFKSRNLCLMKYSYFTFYILSEKILKLFLSDPMCRKLIKRSKSVPVNVTHLHSLN